MRLRQSNNITYLLSCLLTYLLTYLLIHSLAHSLTYSLTHSLTHLLTHSLTYSLTHLLSYLLTYLLTPWCRVLLEKLTGLLLVKEFPVFHGTRRFIAALTASATVKKIPQSKHPACECFLT